MRHVNHVTPQHVQEKPCQLLGVELRFWFNRDGNREITDHERPQLKNVKLMGQNIKFIQN